MNIFYYPIIFFDYITDNLEKVFLPVGNDFLFRCVMGLLILFVVGSLVLTPLTKKEKMRDDIMVYIFMFFFCLEISLSLIWFVSIPLVIYLVQFITFVYNNYDSSKNKIKKSGAVSIAVVFVGFIILLNLVIAIVGV